MRDDALEAVYSYVERAYVRLQAGDLMIRCLEEDSLSPIQQLVEGLFLAGPNNLQAMREVLAEAGRRKGQVQDDLRQVMKGMGSSLRSYGLQLGENCSTAEALKISPVRMITLLKEQNIRDNATQVACLQILKESRDLLSNLQLRLSLLEELETYLQDWMWGMVYEYTHHDPHAV